MSVYSLYCVLGYKGIRTHKVLTQLRHMTITIGLISTLVFLYPCPFLLD